MKPELWGKWWTVHCEKHGKQFSQYFEDEFLLALVHLTDEEFDYAARTTFKRNQFFPTVEEWLELAKEYRATHKPVYQLPASYPKAYAEMSPQEQAEYEGAIAAFRVQLAQTNPLWANLGGMVADAATRGKTLEQHLAEKREWLNDRALRKEALEWLNSREDVSPVFDELGNLIDLEVAT